PYKALNLHFRSYSTTQAYPDSRQRAIQTPRLYRLEAKSNTNPTLIQTRSKEQYKPHAYTDSRQRAIHPDAKQRSKEQYNLLGSVNSKSKGIQTTNQRIEKQPLRNRSRFVSV